MKSPSAIFREVKPEMSFSVWLSQEKAQYQLKNEKGKTERTFDEWLNKKYEAGDMSADGSAAESIGQILQKAATKLKGEDQEQAIEDTTPQKATTILGMQPGIFYTVSIALGVVAVVAVYQITKKS